MNILVIGNGFDLAHKLPTGYPDFLAFCRVIKEVYNTDRNENFDKLWEKLDIKVKYNENGLKMLFSQLYSSSVTEKNEVQENVVRTHTIYDQFYDNIVTNLWIDYFLQNSMYQKENWIDFEGEMAKVIRQLDDDLFAENRQKREMSDNIIKLSNVFLNEYYSAYTLPIQSINICTTGTCEAITYNEIKDCLYNDLNRLTRALEIYLTEYVEKIDCKLISPDIKNAIVTVVGNESQNRSAIISKVICFNYTDTYEKIYSINNEHEKYIDYIHGKAEIDNNYISNNMVLGIDEYLRDERKDKDVEFIEFKKFYQRIYKETGCKYKDWVDEIKESGKRISEKLRGEFPTQIPYKKFTEKHRVFIFGHSLDVTDGDILRDLILNDNVYTTIYYLNKDVYGQQIANLVKVIGVDELIRRTGGSTKTIEFKQQQDMENI